MVGGHEEDIGLPDMELQFDSTRDIVAVDEVIAFGYCETAGSSTASGTEMWSCPGHMDRTPTFESGLDDFVLDGIHCI